MVLLSQLIKKIRSGQSLVEILVALGLSAIILPAIFAGLMITNQGRAQVQERNKAVFLLNEGLEAARIFREKSWVGFAVDGTYHPASSSGTWILSPNSENINGFNRKIVISSVNRDATGKISVVGTNDDSTKLVTATVTWFTPLVATVSASQYFTRYMDNLAHLETTYNDFIAAGTQSGTTVNHTNNDPVDGDITLGGGGHGDWCKPNLSVYAFNLNHNASGKAVSAIEGRAFAVTGDNASSQPFFDILISDTNPPVATSGGQTTNQKKAYGVFGDSSYAYIATDTRKEQGTIISLSNYQEVGWLDLQSNSLNGRSIYVNKNTNLAYLSATDNKIYIFDVSDKTGTKTNIAVSPALSGTALKVAVVGSNLYAALDSTSNQLVIIPLINNGRSFGTPAYVTVNGQGGRDVYIQDDGTRGYLTTAASVNQSEVFIIDTNPSDAKYLQTLSSYDTSGMDPKGITKVTNNKVIIVGEGGVEYQVVDVLNDQIGNCSGGLGDFNFNIYGVASVVEQDGDAYSYIITSDTASEFKIIEGGPTGKVGKSGVFESAVFDLGYSTAFNRLSYDAATPSGTTLRFQAAVADPVSNSCSGSVYVYRDIDSSGAIPMDNDGIGYENPARCFRYKILFDSTSAGTTPVVYSVTVNYSP